jgi:transposase
MFRADRGRKHLNDKERAAIVAFTEAGHTVASISERLDVGAATVTLWQHRFRETGNVMRQRGSGRPKKLTPANEEDIVLAVMAKPITTAQELAGKFLKLRYFYYVLTYEIIARCNRSQR